MKSTLNNKLSNLNIAIDGSLTKSADTLAEADKPIKPLRDFKKEANKIKAEIIASHKQIVEIISLVKKESLKSSLKNNSDTQNGDANPTN